jgi:hypothetical protein
MYIFFTSHFGVGVIEVPSWALDLFYWDVNTEHDSSEFPVMGQPNMVVFYTMVSQF